MELWYLKEATRYAQHLGLGIGSHVQAWSAKLDAISSLTPLNNYFIMGNGTTFVMGTAEAAAGSMGLGRLAYLDNVDDTYWSGAALSVAHGGTGSTTFNTGALPFYNGTNLANSTLVYDSTNTGLSINGTSVPAGSGLGIYGADLSIVAKTSNATPNSLLFHNVDGTATWRIRRKDEGLGTGAASLVISGGVPSADKNALVDRWTIMSTGETILSNATDSNGVGSGSLQLAGGLSVVKAVYGSGKFYLTNTTESTTTDGALIVSGGISVAKKVTAASLTVSGSIYLFIFY